MTGLYNLLLIAVIAGVVWAAGSLLLSIGFEIRDARILRTRIKDAGRG